MATELFTLMAGDIAPHVAGCPSAVVTSYTRKVVIDLCERAKIWRVRADPVVLSQGVYNYAITSPAPETEVSTVLHVNLTSSDTGAVREIHQSTHEVMFKAYPYWPLDGLEGEPMNTIVLDPDNVQLQPIPDGRTTYTLNSMVAVRPTQTATGWDAALAKKFRRSIFHGVLHELMMIPDRKWSDDKTAVYHAKQWGYYLYAAKASVNKGFGRNALTTQQYPWA